MSRPPAEMNHHERARTRYQLEQFGLMVEDSEPPGRFAVYDEWHDAAYADNLDEHGLTAIVDDLMGRTEIDAQDGGTVAVAAPISVPGDDPITPLVSLEARTGYPVWLTPDEARSVVDAIRAAVARVEDHARAQSR